MEKKDEDKIKRILDSSEDGFPILKEKINFAESMFRAGIINADELKTITDTLRKAAVSHSLSGEVELVNLGPIKRGCPICGKDTLQKVKYVYGKTDKKAMLAGLSVAIIGGPLCAIMATGISSARIDSSNRSKRKFYPQKNLYIYECTKCRFSFLASEREYGEMDMKYKRGLTGFAGRKKERQDVRLVI